MPALGMHMRALREQRLRLAIGLLSLSFVASLGAVAPTPVEGRDLTGQISATRSSQLYWEGVMRAADHNVKSLERAHKQAKRHARQARRDLRRARRHRLETRSRARAAGAELRALRKELDGLRRLRAELDQEALPPAYDPFALRQAPAYAPRYPSALPLPALTLAGLATFGYQADAAAAVPGGVTVATEPDGQGTLGGRPESEVVRVELASKERAHAKQKRTYQRLKQRDHKAKRRVSRLARSVRAKSRAVSALGSRRRAAVGRRESAEASLGYSILAMSRPAQLRAAKKSKARPGAGSGFSWPARGRLTQAYGCTGLGSNPSRGSCRHFHDGLDIAGYRGTWIRAAADGVVSYIGWNPWDEGRRAFMVVVAHAGGYETLYGHVLPTRRVRVGEFVRRGEVIGYMGSTGRASGVHLHLEIRRGRTTLNPLAFL